jgi:putative ABC transport system permease protein
MLAKDFLKLVLAGILLASPPAWYLMREWLQDFAFKITLSWHRLRRPACWLWRLPS